MIPNIGALIWTVVTPNFTSNFRKCWNILEQILYYTHNGMWSSSYLAGMNLGELSLYGDAIQL